MTIDEYKDKVRENEEGFKEYCLKTKGWLTMPTGIQAVTAWIDFYYKVLEKNEQDKVREGAVDLCEKFGMGWNEATYLVDYLFTYLDSQGVKIEPLIEVKDEHRHWNH